MSATADLRAARRQWFALLCDLEHPLEVRYRTRTGGWCKEWATTPEQADDHAARLTAGRHDVYAGMLPRIGRTGDDQRRYAPSRVLFADCDTARSVRKLDMFEPTPTATVQSGGVDGDTRKVHAYWLLESRSPPTR